MDMVLLRTSGHRCTLKSVFCWCVGCFLYPHASILNVTKYGMQPKIVSCSVSLLSIKVLMWEMKSSLFEYQ